MSCCGGGAGNASLFAGADAEEGYYAQNQCADDGYAGCDAVDCGCGKTTSTSTAAVVVCRAGIPVTCGSSKSRARCVGGSTKSRAGYVAEESATCCTGAGTGSGFSSG